MKIRLLTRNDLPQRVEWMNDPLVYKNMHFIPPISLEKTLEWHSKNQNNSSRCDVVFEDEDGNLVAMGGLTNIDYTVRKAEFYIFVNPKKQRMGIGSQAANILCKYGFDILNLNKIYLFMNATNTAARRTYEKVGFMLEGRHRDEMICNEKYEDRLYYGLLSTEFKSDLSDIKFKGWSDTSIVDYKDKGLPINLP